MKAMIAQINPIVGSLKENTDKILSVLEKARNKCDIVVFPELTISGYPPEDLLLHPTYTEDMEFQLSRIVEASSNLFILVGLSRKNSEFKEKPLFNSVAVIHNKKILGYKDKTLLPTYDIFDEKRYFESGKEQKVFSFKGKNIGVLICEDIWEHSGAVEVSHYDRDPVKEMKELAPDVVFNLSASPYYYQKANLRLGVCKKAAKSLGCPMVFCNQVGANDQLIFDGYSYLIDKRGEVVAVAKGYEEDLLVVDLFKERKPYSFKQDPIEDLHSSLVLGVRDYFHKQGFTKAILGLSGGVDSALVACIAVKALGEKNVLAVNMPSRYSSLSSIEDSYALSENLGISLEDIPIEPLFQHYLNLFSPYFNGKPLDATEENIQARIRGMILMGLSNKLGYIVLSTGNKSEMAMGYSTLYGDMCGGLGVLIDVSKTLVYKLCNWINREKEIIPESILTKPPSAELAADQKDQDTLPDYTIVDAVLEDYVEEHKSLNQIVEKRGFNKGLVQDLIIKIHRAEYKRRQSPTGIRVTKKAFNRGRNFPIVQKWHLPIEGKELISWELPKTKPN